jgi:alcohol dehydrogenase (NADP+)
VPKAVAYAAFSASDPLSVTTIERRFPGPHDVPIEIRYSGVCHSDIHFTRSEFGQQSYPMVPGHEITGVVAAVGRAVTKHAVGDRVGVGCMVDSCRVCVNCRDGREQYCIEGCVLTYASVGRDKQITQGGYSSHIVTTEDFVVKIPDDMVLAEAAPLLCAGITTYSPLRRSGVGPGSKVAVVGLGGLGHLGVKFAHAFGAEVSVLSQSLRKQEDGRRFGADHYYDTVLNTVSAGIDLDLYLSLLAADGAMVNVGAPVKPLSLNVLSLLTNGRSLTGSSIGGIGETQEMLDFCAERGLSADIEQISADEINEAFERVVASDVRYRFVIDIATLEM